jgi:putative redox protein
MTIQMYARRKGWDIEEVETHVNYNREHAVDCESCEQGSSKIDTFRRDLVIKGNLDKEQTKKILEIADKCPVHRTLQSETQIITTHLSQYRK